MAEICDLPDYPAYTIAQVLAVYEGETPGTLWKVTSEPGLWCRQLHFVAVAGRTCQIAVTNTGDLPRDAECELVLCDAPVNDNFADAIAVSGTNAQLTGSLYNAIREPGEPAVGGQESDGTAWYRWTAPYRSWANIVSSGATAASVYIGTSVERLMPVYQQGFGEYLPKFAVEAGTTDDVTITSFLPGPFSIASWLDSEP